MESMLRAVESRIESGEGTRGAEPAVALARIVGVGVPANDWGFDTVRSSVRFSIRHLMAGRVRGQFTKARGTMSLDPSRPEPSRLSLHIDAGSIDTGDARRDADLRSPDFLHVVRYPRLSFTGTRAKGLGGGRFAVTGTMEIRGVTRDVVLEAQYRAAARDPWGNDHLTLEAKIRIDRAAFGLNWNEVRPAGELFLGDSVDLAMEIEATRLPMNAA
jgi:polyisoprenoid-binding protein YceI